MSGECLPCPISVLIALDDNTTLTLSEPARIGPKLHLALAHNSCIFAADKLGKTLAHTFTGVDSKRHAPVDIVNRIQHSVLFGLSVTVALSTKFAGCHQKDRVELTVDKPSIVTFLTPCRHHLRCSQD